MIVLDTSAIIDLARGGKETVEAIEAAEKKGRSIATTSVSIFELFTPVFHKNMQKKEKMLKTLIQNMTMLPLSQDAAEESARIMGALLKIGRPVNVLDALIAGIAQSNNAEEVLSRDADYKEIAKISNLKIHFIEK